MRPIDADALIKNHFSDEHNIALSYANKVWMRTIINNEPTINCEPVVYAEWVSGDKMPDYCRIPYQPNRHYCSACEMPAVAKDPDRWDIEEFLTPRCPECGAHMKNGG